MPKQLLAQRRPVPVPVPVSQQVPLAALARLAREREPERVLAQLLVHAGS
jgi:hypothetical protein